MQKRIVILGGVGFIGTHLCLRLLEQGHQVFCVDIRDVAYSPLLRAAQKHPGFRYVHHNIINPFGIRCDEIYNLASPSMVRYNKALPVDTLRVGMLGGMNALDTARIEQARLVFASTGDVQDIIRPDTTAQNSAHYLRAEGKRAGEALCRAYHAEYGVDARIARVFNTYGSGAELMDQRVVMKMVVAALQGRDITVNGSGEQLRTFCWVEDIAEGLELLMQAPPSEVMHALNFGSNHEISIRALAEKIISLSGSRSKIVHLEARPDDIRRRAPDISSTRRELGWEPRISLIEGLRRTIGYAEKELQEKAHGEISWAEMI